MWRRRRRRLRKTGHIKLYGPEGFEGMRRAGQLTAQALDEVAGLIGPRLHRGHRQARVPVRHGPQGLSRDAHVSRLPLFGLHLLNHVVCHGMPNARPLRDGDIVNVDITLVVDGWYGDSSRMYAVGNIPAGQSAWSRSRMKP